LKWYTKKTWQRVKQNHVQQFAGGGDGDSGVSVGILILLEHYSSEENFKLS